MEVTKWLIMEQIKCTNSSICLTVSIHSFRLPVPNPQYLPVSLSLYPTLVHLFFLIGLAAGLNISEGAYDENTGTPTALMTAKQAKNSILGQPK